MGEGNFLTKKKGKIGQVKRKEKVWGGRHPKSRRGGRRGDDGGRECDRCPKKEPTAFVVRGTGPQHRRKGGKREVGKVAKRKWKMEHAPKKYRKKEKDQPKTAAKIRRGTSKREKKKLEKDKNHNH